MPCNTRRYAGADDRGDGWAHRRDAPRLRAGNRSRETTPLRSDRRHGRSRSDRVVVRAPARTRRDEASALLAVASGEPPRACARPGHCPRRRREHRKRARDLARARLRHGAARGLGARHRVDRRERWNDLLVRARCHRFIRSRAPVDGVPRISARQRLPALRRRGAPPAGVHSSSSERVCRQASPRTTTSRSTSSAPSCTRSSLRGPARPPTGSGPKASDHSRRGCSAERRAASSI